MGKILITGGAGYIGTHTICYLLQHGYNPEDIIVFDNLVYGNREFLPANINFIKGDLLNKNDIISVFKRFGINDVIHFAAYAYVGESMKEPGKYFQNNIFGGLNLLEAMVIGGCCNIVFSSTCATYGFPPEGKITEDSPLEPINPYGESKLCFERILNWYHRIYCINSISLRYFNAAGADFNIGEHHNPETHIIPLIIETAQGKRELFTIYGDNYDTLDGTCIRDYIHVTDLARAHFSALAYLQKNSGCEAVNLGSGKGVSVQEIVVFVQEIAGKEFLVEVGSRREGDPAVLVADSSKAFNLLGWMPKKDIHQILRSAWKWHQRDGK